jgi:alkylation response protein AidB-like acyl-CoA dehydrogenase
VDFELSEDQVALRDAARELLDGLASPTQVRAVVDAGGGPDPTLWGALVEQGWTAIERPADRGGLGLTTLEVAVLAEEVGRHVAPVPFLSSTLAAWALEAAGESEAVERLQGGDAIGCVAWSHRSAAVRAARDRSGWRLSGRADPVVEGPAASIAVVTAEGDEGSGVFAVDLDEPLSAEPAMDRTRQVGWLTLDRTLARRLGGPDLAAALVDRGAALTAAEMLGAADRALEMAVEYAKDRVQFGRPIGSFQAVKHRCADMLVDVEGMRSTVYWAAWCLAAGDPEASVAASTAKVWAGDASKRVMASALQVHGGIGFTWEHDLHLFMKRAQLDQLRFGDATYHRDRLASLLRPRVEAGESVI